MAIQKTIIIDFPTSANGELVHYVRNLGEDFWRLIERKKLGDVGGLEAIDCATNQLVVRVFHARKVMTVRKLVEQLIKNRFLDDHAIVTYN